MTPSPQSRAAAPSAADPPSAAVAPPGRPDPGAAAPPLRVDRHAAPPAPWAADAASVLAALGVRPERGLEPEEARRRLAVWGPNRLRPPRRRSAWSILRDQFASIIVVLLAAAAGVAFAFGDHLEGAAILAVIVLNAAIGFVTELRAVRSMEALRRLGRVESKTRRGGALGVLPAEELVPGDIVVLEGGDVVPADMRIIAASKLQADESALTGESLPVSKTSAAVDGHAVIGDRRSMLFKGTTTTRGAGEGVVVATGMASQLGEISALLDETEEGATPLERRLDKLGRNLVGVTLGIAALTTVAGILTGKSVTLMIQTGIALAVAAIPEGLPIVATVALARGMWRMAQRNALVRRLSAVETLGATGVICADKTGTLTENRLAVVRYALATGDVTVARGESCDAAACAIDGAAFTREGRTIDAAEQALLREALVIGAFCNNASIAAGAAAAADGSADGAAPAGVGDPLEVALLQAAALAGIHRADLVAAAPEEREEAFDADVKMMATFHRDGDGFRVAAKGAGDAIVAAATHELTAHGEAPLTPERRRHWLERDHALAAGGLRVLALATRRVAALDARPYQDLVLVGLVGLLDPPRCDIRDAIAACRRAGIGVVMITGDQPATALCVARAVGLMDGIPADDADAARVFRGDDLPDMATATVELKDRIRRARVFARVSPRQKLALIAAHQEAGTIVGMTGDGVNDAPALKKADIGIAMGRRGTDVAREAAEIVLKDDAFSTIVAAVRDGRVIFDNIRRFVMYLMSCNASEILVVGLAAAVKMPLPILPLQILFLNLVTDVFPALALGMGAGDPHVLERPPRDPREPILAARHWRAIACHAGTLTAAVLGSFAIARMALGLDGPAAVTVSFLTLAFGQLWHVFNMRDRRAPLLANDVVRNPHVWGALALCVGLLLAAVHVPFLAEVLELTPPRASGWALVLAASLMPLFVGQSAKAWRVRRETRG